MSNKPTDMDRFQGKAPPDFGVRFGVAAAQVAYLLGQKRRDYGWRNITESGPEGVIVRLQDKLNRLRTLGSDGRQPANESIEDTWKDVAGYGIIGLLLQRGNWILPTDSDAGGAIPLPDTEEIRPTPPLWDGVSPRIVYLGGPIDCTTPDKANGWRTDATTILNHMGIAVYNPVAAFSWAGGPEGGFPLAWINQVALQTCSASLFHLPSDVLTVGSIAEIREAASGYVTKKNVVVWGDEKVANNLYLATWGVPVRPTLVSAIEHLVKQRVAE